MALVIPLPLAEEAEEAEFSDLLAKPELSIFFFCLVSLSSGLTCHADDAGVADVLVVAADAVDDC